MHHALILELFYQQPALLAPIADLQQQLNQLRQAAYDPEISLREVTEEVDYLLMAGLLKGSRELGYHTSILWDEIAPEARDQWRCHGDSYRDRLELIDPIDIPRPERHIYPWEINQWFSFEFCICRHPEPDGDQDIALISGLFRGGSPIIGQVRRVVVTALNQWYLTPEGATAWEQSMADFNIGDLGNYTKNYALSELLKAAGIRGLAIEDYFASGDWIYDNVLGSLPDPIS